ncbi:unnamed protein product [Nippostrongylus brasiliensis]|uniref:Uncharacterized protein n=1 Tax=Nippostrongylus brasiliensis TaxID=27835 RepID=A0A0N4XHC5_NIPBR|nr:unnamed protein product [Nippostrongylus brasiliensis]
MFQESVEPKQTLSDVQSEDFVYNTSTQYPSTTPFESTTYKHFSFDNVNDDKSSTLSNEIQHEASGMEADQEAIEASGENVGVISSSERSSFVYKTSTQYPHTTPFETSTLQHFSFGNAPTAVPTMQKDPTTPTPNEELINRLRSIAQEAPNYSTIQLATKLSALVENLLLSMQEEQNARRI